VKGAERQSAVSHTDGGVEETTTTSWVEGFLAAAGHGGLVRCRHETFLSAVNLALCRQRWALYHETPQGRADRGGVRAASPGSSFTRACGAWRQRAAFKRSALDFGSVSMGRRVLWALARFCSFFKNHRFLRPSPNKRGPTLAYNDHYQE